MEVLRVGHPVPHVVNTDRIIVAAVLFILAGILYGIRRIAERRRI
jgi:hypothetical protein